MNERNLNEGQWEDRKQWSLGVGQRRKTFWTRYIHTYTCIMLNMLFFPSRLYLSARNCPLLLRHFRHCVHTPSNRLSSYPISSRKNRCRGWMFGWQPFWRQDCAVSLIRSGYWPAPSVMVVYNYPVMCLNICLHLTVVPITYYSTGVCWFQFK